MHWTNQINAKTVLVNTVILGGKYCIVSFVSCILSLVPTSFSCTLLPQPSLCLGTVCASMFTSTNFLLFFAFRPCPNDQTLLVKHLRFACETNFFIIWLHNKTLLIKNFAYGKQKMFLKFETLPSLFCLPSCVLLRVQTVKHCKTNLKCLTFNVWSLGHGLPRVATALLSNDLNFAKAIRKHECPHNHIPLTRKAINTIKKQKSLIIVY